MTSIRASRHLTPLAKLRRFARPQPAVERCELCAASLPPEHEHLVEPVERRLLCACTACAILFPNQSATRYRRVPRRVEFLRAFRLGDLRWESLEIPIELAFFFESTSAGRVTAVYPSPAGPVESLLPFDAWAEVVAENPILREFEPDVEALLVHRAAAGRECYRVPIDECYRLVGLIRTHWQGFSGGRELEEETERFFEQLKARSC
ncbi:MAG: hypothetical protein KY476_22040 [Planctomycetes bacterium]|nr:hypothetical protein [Planctomycetota bacterium]